MNVFLRVAVGIGTIFFGLMIYPYYVDYMLTPLIGIVEEMVELTAWESALLGVVPFAAFCVIIFFGLMYMMGKLALFKEQPDRLLDDDNKD